MKVSPADWCLIFFSPNLSTSSLTLGAIMPRHRLSCISFKNFFLCVHTRRESFRRRGIRHWAAFHSKEAEKMIKSTWKVHTIAQCQDCNWTTSNYKNGQAISAIHAKSHKHMVTGEIGLAFEYNGKEAEKMSNPHCPECGEMVRKHKKHHASVPPSSRSKYSKNFWCRTCWKWIPRGLAN